MIVGFTGSRKGVTKEQLIAISFIIGDVGITEGHHGDCIGADEEFHNICQLVGIPVVIHPPWQDTLRAFCKGAILVEKRKSYLERNKNIVNECDLLIGAPKENEQPAVARGQGTWSTIRYARKLGKHTHVVMPDGLDQGG